MSFGMIFFPIFGGPGFIALAFWIGHRQIKRGEYEKPNHDYFGVDANP